MSIGSDHGSDVDMDAMRVPEDTKRNLKSNQKANIRASALGVRSTYGAGVKCESLLPAGFDLLHRVGS
jgi:hypothetical protein